MMGLVASAMPFLTVSTNLMESMAYQARGGIGSKLGEKGNLTEDFGKRRPIWADTSLDVSAGGTAGL